MIQRRLLTRGQVALVIGIFLTSGPPSCVFAQAYNTIHNGWRITIDESPSPEFVAQSIADLKELFPPFELAPDQPWCCYIGNYGGALEPMEIADEYLPFFRLTDDLDEEWAPLRTFWTGTLCSGKICSTLTQFNLVQGSPTELMMYLREAVEPDFDPIANNSIGVWRPDESVLSGVPLIGPSYVPTPADVSGNFGWKLEDGVYPVYVGIVGPQQLSPTVWSVTLSTTPEPSSAILCWIAVTAVGLHRRKVRPSHRPNAT